METTSTADRSLRELMLERVVAGPTEAAETAGVNLLPVLSSRQRAVDEV